MWLLVAGALLLIASALRAESRIETNLDPWENMMEDYYHDDSPVQRTQSQDLGTHTYQYRMRDDNTAQVTDLTTGRVDYIKFAAPMYTNKQH